MIAPAKDGRTAPDAWSQAGRLAFRGAQVVVALLLLGWATGNIRQVPPDSRAVVLRFGQPDRVRNPGLLLAWPEPIERIVLVPSADRQLDHVVERFRLADTGDEAGLRMQTDADVRRNRGFLLTGDLGVAHLGATLTYRIAEPVRYVIAERHVLPALERLFATTATAVCAGRKIDVLMAIGGGTAAQPPATQSGEPVEPPDMADGEEPAQPPTAAAADDRGRLRDDLVEAVNARLAALAADGAGLGIEVTRVDLTASLPPVAKVAFDAVLRAQQQAEQFVANARNAATRTAQVAEQGAARRARDAEARASELLANASTQTAAIAALSEHGASDPAGKPVALQLYRERMAALLQTIDRVTAVDMRGGTRLILPGPE